MTSAENNRKRKQELSSSLPTSMTNWGDFIYSSPSSPSNENQDFNSLLTTAEGTTNSRRHSVAVGELDYHSFDFIKQYMNENASWDDLQQLLLDTEGTSERPIHKRTLSLREDNPDYATLLSPALSTTSSHFFSSSFLDAMVAENNADASTMISDMSSLANDDFLNLANTITPTVVTKEINTMADWLLEQTSPKKQRHTSLSSFSTFGSSMSSNSPSPPMQFSNVVSEPTIQEGPNYFTLKPFIQDYLMRKERNEILVNERTVMVLTSRVAQKSYGTEKRFLCPPPTTILKGKTWWSCAGTSTTTTPLFQSPECPPKLTIHISGETINQNGVLEWQNSNGTIIDPATNPSSAVTGRCVSKQLYINDADEKRKRIQVLAKIQSSNGLPLGSFPSKGIKVISKPSKKRQSIKNMEICIHHGTTVSLFNRIRSQTVSTKYLGVSTSSDNNNGTCFAARTGFWDPFVIWIVDTKHTPDTREQPQPHPHNPDYPSPPAIALQSSNTLAIHYNQPVVLQCVTTGLVSPVMIIRKVDKGSMVVGGTCSDDATAGGECGDETLGDPISQLQKVAFQIVQDPTPHTKQKETSETYTIPQSCHPVTYLACLNDVVGMHKVNSTRHLVSTHTTVWNEDVKNVRNERSLSEGLKGACWTEDVSDAAVWTIVGTECASYTFFTPSQDQKAITPFPVVMHTKKTSNTLIMTGENFSRDITVWFGDCQSPHTEYKSRDTLVCKIPDTQLLSPTGNMNKVPILFVRSDGVIYRTNQSYTF